MAKRGRYSNKTHEQADVFVDMMDGDVDAAFNLAADRLDMFWEEAEEGERDEQDVKDAASLTNLLGLRAKRQQ